MSPTDTRYTCVDHFCVTDEPPTDREERPQPGVHILDIDLRLARGPRDFQLPERTELALYKRVYTRLADIAQKDQANALDDRIDAIRVNDGGPSRRMWSIFRSLNPRHLFIIGGPDEDCYFEPLQGMKTWDRLETIAFGGICTSDRAFRLPPFALRTLKSLELHMCLGMDIRPTGGAAPTLSLENLYLHTNDVGSSAAMILKNFPSIKRTLTRLTVHSNGCGYDTDEEREGIRRVLAECTKLIDVKLSLRVHHAAEVSSFFPNSLQRLEFAGERSMLFLPQIDDWIARAKDKNWAPNLRYLSFTVDREELAMPDRFFGKSNSREELDEQEPQISLQEIAARYGVQLVEINHEDEQHDQELFDDNDDPTESDAEGSAFDDDADVFEDRHFFDEEGSDDDNFDDVDLDNIPGIGPHPNHAPKRNAMRSYTLDGKEIPDAEAAYQKRMKDASVGEEDLAKFEELFEAKKKELVEVLRMCRPEVEVA